MASVQQAIPSFAVSTEQMTALKSGIDGFGREQLIWSSGYLAGLADIAESQPVALAAVPVASAVPANWTVFYATETGNSRRVSEELAAQASQSGIQVTVVNIASYKPRSLAKVDNALFVLATHGIGESPEGSEAFFEYWLSDKAPQLSGLNYSVLALGDSSYADYCEMGRVFDARLQQLGATAVVDRVECDLDYEQSAENWSRSVIDVLEAGDNVVDMQVFARPQSAPLISEVSRSNPFSAEILSRQVITGPDSDKRVYHVELDLEDSGIQYQPGDSLALRPENSSRIVSDVLDAVGFDGDESVVIDGNSADLRTVLTTDKDITLLSRPVLDQVASQRPDMARILDDRNIFSDFLRTHQLIDLVSDYPIDWSPQEFVGSLRKLMPRSYSISSSPIANPDEAHLTVAVVDYVAHGRRHFGTTSNFLAGDATHVPVYVEANNTFRLPENSDAPVIMIGAGTGVAPYRAFLEHRREQGHNGENWLIFGERTFANDFLYQIEWLRHRKDGILNRLDVAFSRDQVEKIYVQNRIIENGARLYDWLQRGAHLYVCGDAFAMASDVHDALLAVVQRFGNHSAESAEAYLADLKSNSRYQRDVY